MPTIYETLRADIVTAMKARDTTTATALRTMDAAIQRAAMDTNKSIDDALVTTAFRKAVKNLTDARTEFEKGGRPDLVAVNTAELAILEKYLPKGLEPARLEALITEVIAATGAASKKEMGKVIGALKQRPEAPLIDFGAASKLIQAKLPRRLMLKALGRPLAIDLAVSLITLVIHWGTFSGIMAASVAGVLTSLATSGAKRLFGFIHNGVYFPGIFHVRVE